MSCSHCPAGALLCRGLFVAGAEFEPDGGADEAEGGADLVGEEALEGEVEFDVAVGEEDEGGRGDGGLGHVVDVDAAVHGDGGALEVDVGEEAVHLAGGDALAALAGDEFDFLEERLDALAGGGGEEDEGGVVEELEVVADLLLVDAWGRRGLRLPVTDAGPSGRRGCDDRERLVLGFELVGGRVGGGVGDEVPLVDDDDDGAAGLVGVAADVGVEGGDAFGGVEDEEARRRRLRGACGP